MNERELNITFAFPLMYLQEMTIGANLINLINHFYSHIDTHWSKLVRLFVHVYSCSLLHRNPLGRTKIFAFECNMSFDISSHHTEKNWLLDLPIDYSFVASLSCQEPFCGMAVWICFAYDYRWRSDDVSLYRMVVVVSAIWIWARSVRIQCNTAKYTCTRKIHVIHIHTHTYIDYRRDI